MEKSMIYKIYGSLWRMLSEMWSNEISIHFISNLYG